MSRDAPAYVRDRTPLRKGQMTTLALRDEFRRDPSLPMLLGDDIFIKGIRRGIEQGDYVYQRGDLLFGPGDPPARHPDRRAGRGHDDGLRQEQGGLATTGAATT